MVYSYEYNIGSSLDTFHSSEEDSVSLRGPSQEVLHYNSVFNQGPLEELFISSSHSTWLHP